MLELNNWCTNSQFEYELIEKENLDANHIILQNMKGTFKIEVIF